MMEEYNPINWFWIVGGDESKAWSSAVGEYLTEYPPGRLTRIANEVELYDVLARLNLASKAPQRSFTVAEVRGALVQIDADATGDANDVSELTAVASSIGVMLPAFA